jgi:hypothetical protein
MSEAKVRLGLKIRAQIKSFLLLFFAYPRHQDQERLMCRMACLQFTAFSFLKIKSVEELEI